MCVVLLVSRTLRCCIVGQFDRRTPPESGVDQTRKSGSTESTFAVRSVVQQQHALDEMERVCCSLKYHRYLMLRHQPQWQLCNAHSEWREKFSGSELRSRCTSLAAASLSVSFPGFAFLFLLLFLCQRKAFNCFVFSPLPVPSPLFALKEYSPPFFLAVFKYLFIFLTQSLHNVCSGDRRARCPVQRPSALLQVRLRWCRLLLRHPRCSHSCRCVSHNRSAFVQCARDVVDAVWLNAGGLLRNAGDRCR